MSMYFVLASIAQLVLLHLFTHQLKSKAGHHLLIALTAAVLLCFSVWVLHKVSKDLYGDEGGAGHHPLPDVYAAFPRLSLR